MQKYEARVIDNNLFQAIEEGDIFQVNALSQDKEYDPNCYDAEGVTPLIRAIIKSDIQMVNLLLETGAVVNYETQNGSSPIHFATQNLTLLTVLIEYGADINKHNPLSGYSILHYAALSNHTNTMSKILNLGVDINITCNNQFTPLHVASFKGHIEAVATLLELGANIEARNNVGCTPLHLATAGDHTHVVRLLLDKGANFKATSDNGCRALHYASIGREETTNTLLKYDSDINYTNALGMTPLNYMIQSCDPAKINLPNLKDHKMNRLLWNVFSSKKSITTLLKMKDPTACSEGGRSKEAIQTYYNFLKTFKKKNKLVTIDSCLTIIDKLLTELEAVTFDGELIQLVWPDYKQSVIIETGVGHSLYGVLTHYSKHRYELRLIERGEFAKVASLNPLRVYPERRLTFSAKNAAEVLTKFSQSQSKIINNCEHILFSEIPLLAKKSYYYSYIKKPFEGPFCYIANFKSLIFSEMIHFLGLVGGKSLYNEFILHTYREALESYQSHFKLSEDDEIVKACLDAIQKKEDKIYYSALEYLASREEDEVIDRSSIKKINN